MDICNEKVRIGVKRWKEKIFFYNPIKQNRSHIKSLEKLLQVGEDKYVSLITFNANANLKKVSTESSGIYVVGYKQLKKFMKKQTDKPDILTDEQIENIYQQLLPGTKLSDEEKQEHVNRIKQQYKNNYLTRGKQCKCLMFLNIKPENQWKSWFSGFLFYMYSNILTSTSKWDIT